MAQEPFDNHPGAQPPSVFGPVDPMPDYLFDVTESERPMCDAAADVLRTVHAAAGWSPAETLRFVAAAVEGPQSTCCAATMMPTWAAEDGAFDLIVYYCTQCGAEQDLLSDRIKFGGWPDAVTYAPLV